MSSNENKSSDAVKSEAAFSNKQRAYLKRLFAIQRIDLHRLLASEISVAIEKQVSRVSVERDALLDSRQVCILLNCSRRKLDHLVSGGELKPIRIGRKRLFARHVIDQFIRNSAL